MLFKSLLFSKFILMFLTSFARGKEHYLEPGISIKYDPLSRNRGEGTMDIYCYRGKPKYIIHIWQSISLNIDSKYDDYVQYDGVTPEEVEKKYMEHISSWSINLFSWKSKHFKLDPFNQSCVGIDSRRPYTVYLNMIRVDYWKVVLLLLGIFMFVTSDKLSKNTIFHYVCGITFGICASFLILIYFLSKLFPKKPMMYGVAVCGWTVGVYILQLLWENVQTIFVNYNSFVMGYICIVGLISFIVCYRWGPVSNSRTRNLIRWSLKCFGLSCIFFSSHFQEAAMGQIVILLIIHNFPKTWVSKSRTYWKRKFPPKVKLLSNDEYYHQGVKETTKALEELREYCSSPKCNQWKTVLKLKDVKRFASFIEGSAHLSDDEILGYEASIHNTELTDDEDEAFLTDEEI